MNFTRITIKAVSPDGWPVDFEIDPQEARTGEAIAYLERYGFRAQMMPAQEVAEAGMGGGSQTSEAFLAETLTATVDNGKAYWRVRGAQFQKFGVVVYPEVLAAAGFDVDKLNPLKPVDLGGMTAVYSLKENGKPGKVIRLERGG